MKVLLVAQTVDTEDPVLGFFVRWIEEFAKQCEQIEVICLKEGKHGLLPTNVRVHSLGKENGTTNRAIYTLRFLSLVWKLRTEYDAVFVHMNQEYILIAGWLWKLLGKRVYMWRNHYAGSWLTDVAALFCAKVFCTSKHSYTAKYAKTILMPVGVDTKRFFPDARVVRAKGSILFLSRMSPSKRPLMLIDALATLTRSQVSFAADFYGSPLPQDVSFYEKLKEKVRTLGLESHVHFYPGPRNDQAPDIFRAHEIFVNTSPSGMLDKTIFEAAASGCITLAASDDWRKMAGEVYSFDNADSLAERLQKTFAASADDHKKLVDIASSQSLSMLAEKLFGVIV